MQLAVHELQELHEMTLSCVTSITSMGLYLNHARDPELRGMIQSQLPFHVAAYNKQMAYVTDGAVSQEPFPVPPLSATLDSPFLVTTAVNPPEQTTPRTAAQTLNDREIATAYLLHLKRTGRDYAWAAMESANPELRNYFEDAFRLCSHHAYEVWEWMVRRGLYPLEPAPARTNYMLGGMYVTLAQPPQMVSQVGGVVQ